jgi:hypothetical protein
MAQIGEVRPQRVWIMRRPQRDFRQSVVLVQRSTNLKKLRGRDFPQACEIVEQARG